MHLGKKNLAPMVYRDSEFVAVEPLGVLPMHYSLQPSGRSKAGEVKGQVAVDFFLDMAIIIKEEVKVVRISRR